MLDPIHKPVLLTEVVEGLRPKNGGRYADGTVGGAGHAAAILKASAPTGWLFGCDRDGDALERVRRVLAPFEGRFELRRGNFDQLDRWIEGGSLDGVLLDLGVSSFQLEEAERGFSFQAEGALDMRMDRSQGRTATDVVNHEPPEELARMFRELGDERNARRIARAIERERQRRPIRTTRQLAELVEQVEPRRGRRIHPATRVFQALRMTVNDELGSVQRGLDAAWRCLKPGGRLAVIAFHSGEDRLVKWFGRNKARNYRVLGEVDRPEFRVPCEPEAIRVTRKPILPNAQEQQDNPRSRSAQMRIVEKK